MWGKKVLSSVLIITLVMSVFAGIGQISNLGYANIFSAKNAFAADDAAGGKANDRRLVEGSVVHQNELIQHRVGEGFSFVFCFPKGSADPVEFSCRAGGVNQLFELDIGVSIDGNIKTADEGVGDLTVVDRRADEGFIINDPPNLQRSLAIYKDDEGIVQIAQTVETVSGTKYAIWKLDATNVGSSTIDDLRIGALTDWEVEETFDNDVAQYNAANDAVIQSDGTGSSTFVGMSSTTQSSGHHVTAVSDSLTDPLNPGRGSDASFVLSNPNNFDGPNVSPADMAGSLAWNLGSLQPGASTTLNVILAVGESLEDLTNEINAAKESLGFVFEVSVVQAGEGVFEASVNVGNIQDDVNLNIKLQGETGGAAQLQEVLLPFGVAGNLGTISIRQFDNPDFRALGLPLAPTPTGASPILLAVDATGEINISDSASFRDQVNIFLLASRDLAGILTEALPDGCPNIQVFVLNEETDLWDPVLEVQRNPAADTDTLCGYIAANDHSSRFSVGGLKRATGTGETGQEFTDVREPSLSGAYWKPDEPLYGEDVAVNVRASDDVGVDKATLRYQSAVDDYRKDYSVSMSKLNSDWFSAKVPGQHVTTPSFKFWITASDFAGNTATTAVTEVDVSQGSTTSVKASTTNLPPHVLEAIKPKVAEPVAMLQVTSSNDGKEIKVYPEQIVIKNIGQVRVDSIRVMLSPEISKSFRLSETAIPVIEPNESVTLTLQLNGNPNRDAFGGIVGYSGDLMVMSEHSTPITLPVNIGGKESLFLTGYLAKVASMASLRYNKVALLNDLLSAGSEATQDFEIGTSSGNREVTNTEEELIITNTSDRQINNLRIVTSSLGTMFLLENPHVKTLAPNESVTVKLTPRIDSSKYSPKDFLGEIIVVADNGSPQVIPIKIEAQDAKDSMSEFEVGAGSLADTVRNVLDTITIENTAERYMDSVKISLSRNLERVLDLSDSSFKNIAPGQMVSVDLKFKAAIGEKKELYMQDYIGEITVMSEHHNLRNIPIQIEWEKTESKHFTVYTRVGQEEVGKQVIDQLESKYDLLTSELGKPYSKTVIYLAPNIDELKLVSPSGQAYYSYADDAIFACACDEPAYDAMKALVNRIVMTKYLSYYNMKALTFNTESWLLTGLSDHITANMFESNMARTYIELDDAENVDSGQFGTTSSFLEFLETEYGAGVTDKILENLNSGLTINHKCSSIEECSVLNAVYEVKGWDPNKRRYTLTFDELFAQWETSGEIYYNSFVTTSDLLGPN